MKDEEKDSGFRTLPAMRPDNLIQIENNGFGKYLQELGKGEKALGTVVSGNGNNGDDKTEGVIYKQVYGTYFHGPILTRNGNLTKRILKNALLKRYPDVDWQAKLDGIPTESF
ncbi:hypothetical protein ATW93_10195 [Oenococcus oeni]|nr:hypothetical protein ATW93_10195 [Oenococcus oeni]